LHRSNKFKSRTQTKPKADTIVEDKPYYAEVEYSISTLSGRKYLENYAIVHKCWAYIKDDYKKAIIKKRISGENFHISKRHSSRPEDMPEDVANAIMEKIYNP